MKIAGILLKLLNCFFYIKKYLKGNLYIINKNNEKQNIFAIGGEFFKLIYFYSKNF